MVNSLSEVPNPTYSGVRRNTSEPREASRIFLLSPANVGGIRAGLVMHESRNSEMAIRLRQNGVPVGELFSFMSSLYFRGKLAYALAFAVAPPGLTGAFVITASGGLVSPDTVVTLDRLREICSGNVDPADPQYRTPLDRDARILCERAGEDCAFVLLGSVATSKYVDPLLKIFGGRLLFPAEFVGRGDMSRGGLMLRCVQSREQLTYIPILNATRTGVRPPKLDSLRPASKRLASGSTQIDPRDVCSPEQE
jgi:hypothetical protein